MSLTEKENQAVAELSRTLRGKYGDRIKQILLYGSKARGDSTWDSDIDLFILVDKEDKELKDFVSDCSFGLDLKYDVVLQIIIWTQEKYNDPYYQVVPFFNNVIREGIKI